MGREDWSCIYCGSTVRFRSIVHVLSMELFGESIALPDFPLRKDLVGLGLSDWEGYAQGLAEKFSYTNAFYHQEPRLDICKPDVSFLGQFDFLIASEVFEHVVPPVSLAFENARKLLKPGGVLIFSVPYIEGETREHFPNLHNYTMHQKDGEWLLLNRTVLGEEEIFGDLVFHGGPGSTLELRVFGKDSLERAFPEAGFGCLKVYSEPHEAHGLVWISYDPEKASYQANILGLDTPPWSARVLHGGQA